MYIRNYPEDSVLKRHFEASVALKRQAWQQRPPSDAILRRHYEQLHGAGNPPPAQGRISQPETQPVSNASVDATKIEQKQGLVGWMRRLFGG